MNRAVILALCLPALALPAAAELPAAAAALPPGLQSARLLPGWTDAEGNRIAALELRLEPGWKTYWRQPGDSGLPPEFDWMGSDNLAGVTLHWPAPEVIRSGDDLTLGYHDRLILPFTARAATPGQPVRLSAEVDLGLCERICVPAHLSLEAPEAGAEPDPAIAAALARVPAPVALRPTCLVSAIDDGMRLSVLLPKRAEAAGDQVVAAMELSGQPDVWVSQPLLAAEAEGLRATSDFVGPSGAPFDLDPQAVRITQIGPEGATEMQGCDPQG